MRQLAYNMFIINNYASFHFWWKEYFWQNIKKSQNVMTFIVVLTNIYQVATGSYQMSYLT